MKDKPFKDIWFFSRYVRPYRAFYTFTFTSLLIQTILGLLQPVYYRRMIDDVFNAPNPRDHLRQFIGIVLVLAAIRAVSTILGMLSTVFNTRVTTAATNALEFDILQKLHHLPMKYHDQHAPGEIFPRLYNDPSMPINFFISYLPQLVASFFRVVIVFFVILFHLWWAGLLSLIPLLPMWFISKNNIRYFRKLSDQQFEKHQSLYIRVLDMLHGMKIVRVFGRSEAEMKRFRDIQTDLRQLHIKASVRNSWMSPLISSIGKLGGGIVFIAGAARLLQFIHFDDSEFTLGTLFMVLSYVWQLAAPVTSFASFSSEFGNIRGASTRLIELLNEAEQERPAQSQDQRETVSQVVVQNVDFSYEPGKRILSDISFSIRKGEKVGLVGPSGSGKTTILNLICGFYPPDSGSILLNGYKPECLPKGDRPVLSIAMQAGDLFRGTVRENLCYGRTSCSDREIQEVLALVEAGEFTSSLPNGLETIVGEGGRVLSSGQTQRLSLARAILAGADVLVLDESTSWVDLWTEQRIFQRLLKNFPDQTVICISHRLHLMQLMDRVLVIRDGTLVNQGTHAKLVVMDPFYGSSWDLRDCDGNLKE